MEFSRQEYWSGLQFPPPGNYPKHGIKSRFPALQAGSLPSEPPGEPTIVFVTQACPTLCIPMDYSQTYSSVHEILQARILEWVVIPFSRGIFLTQALNLGLPNCRQILYHLSHQGSPVTDFISLGSKITADGN